MAKIVAKFRFHVVADNTRKAARTYDGMYRRCMIRQGAAVRKHAWFSIRYRRQGYPRPHTGAYHQNIRFAWDRGSKTVIVGPTRLKHFNVPRALEYGGTSRRLIRGRVIRLRDGQHRIVPGGAQSKLQRVRRFGTMRRALASEYIQRQFYSIASEELR